MIFDESTEELTHEDKEVNIEKRLERIEKLQNYSESTISRLRVIFNQLDDGLNISKLPSEESVNDPGFLNLPSSCYDMLLQFYAPKPTSVAPSSPTEEIKFSAKRRKIDDELEYREFSAKNESLPKQKHQEITHEYPKQVCDNVILGPNGTKVDMRSYNSIIWSSTASATRQLLGFVFSNDTLATHTLTGKPSPAFYGRERPAKMQLDPVSVADIIHCVRSKFKCTEREVRAAITTKCSDTSKKYKRRHQKQLESSQAAIH